METEKELLIENKLYSQVKILLEGHYNLEGVINSAKKDSDNIVFKNKKEAIKLIVEKIIDFATENNLTVNEVKNYLLKIINNDISLDNMHVKEYKELNEIVSNFSDKEEEK